MIRPDAGCTATPANPLLQQVIDRMRGWKAEATEANEALDEILVRVFGDIKPPPSPEAARPIGESFECVFGNMASDLDDVLRAVERKSRQINNRV